MHPRPTKPAEGASFEGERPAVEPFVRGSAAAGRPAAFRPKRRPAPASSRLVRRPGWRQIPPGYRQNSRSRPSPLRRPPQSRSRRRPGQVWRRSGKIWFRTPAAGRSFDRPDADRPDARVRSDSRPAGRPAWKKDDRRPARRRVLAQAQPGRTGPIRIAAQQFDRPGSGRNRQNRRRPSLRRQTDLEEARTVGKAALQTSPLAPRREDRDMDDDLGPVRPPNLQIDEISDVRSAGAFNFQPSSAPRSYSDRSGSRGSAPTAPVRRGQHPTAPLRIAPVPTFKFGKASGQNVRPRPRLPPAALQQRRRPSARLHHQQRKTPRRRCTAQQQARRKPGGRSYGSGSGARSGGSGSYGSGPGARSGGPSSQSIDPRTGFRLTALSRAEQGVRLTAPPAVQPSGLTRHAPKAHRLPSYQSKPYPNSTPALSGRRVGVEVQAQLWRRW